MPKKIPIQIQESEKELRLLLNKTTTDRLRGRLKALILIKSGKVEYQSELASKLGFTEKTIREWLKRYQSYGLSSLITLRVGGNRKLSFGESTKDFITQRLSDPQTTITSYVELQQLILDNCGEEINYKTLYGYCTRHFNSKLKVSRKSHYKKDDQAIEAFKKTT